MGASFIQASRSTQKNLEAVDAHVQTTEKMLRSASEGNSKQNRSTTKQYNNIT